MDAELLQALAVTAELTGTELSENAVRIMALDLSRHPLPLVLESLTRCRRELKGRLTLADILDRIRDGHPGPEEAFALLPRSERDAATMTEQVAESWGIVARLLDEGEEIAARMAFKEHYGKSLSRARAQGIPPRWFLSRCSVGDSATRELTDATAVQDAIDRGYLTFDTGLKLLPYSRADNFELVPSPARLT